MEKGSEWCYLPQCSQRDAFQVLEKDIPACKASKTSFSLKKIHRPSKRGRERTVSFLK